MSVPMSLPMAGFNSSFLSDLTSCARSAGARSTRSRLRPDIYFQSAAALARRVTQASIVSSIAYTTFLICLSTSLSCVALFNLVDSGSSKVLKDIRSFVSSRSSSSVPTPERRSACDVSSRDTLNFLSRR
ncbi:bacterial type II secretion system protein [Striga asiatica]|uniref:Bacterial type II secretion system protein n=1 Tax=Striga asiatica TaxID=4170 RepID=A0A5A7PNG4_STRAF|nr:bacterial type II secretion system protein [Striga asiatica]